MDIKRIHDMKESLTEWAKEEIGKGKTCVDTKEMGEVIDMIKDLAEAEKCCYEAKYYCHINEAMEEEKKEMEKGGKPWMAGYDSWRFPSSGRFAPTGSGRRYGYMPWYDPMIYGGQAEWQDNARMGYGQGNSGGNRGSSQGGMSGSSNSGRSGFNYYPTNYERYQDARRHYTETHSPEDKREMDESAREHLDESIESLKDIWREADPEMKRRMKANLSSFVNEMN